MQGEGRVMFDLGRSDMAILQNALFDYENCLKLSRPGRSGAKWAAKDIERIQKMREAISSLQADPSSMPLLFDSNPEWPIGT